MPQIQPTAAQNETCAVVTPEDKWTGDVTGAGAFSLLAGELMLAIRRVDYLGGGDAERFTTADVIADGWRALKADPESGDAVLREPLRRALRVLEAFEADAALPERGSDVVDAGLVALLEAGYSPDLLCDDTQFDRGALPAVGVA